MANERPSPQLDLPWSKKDQDAAVSMLGKLRIGYKDLKDLADPVKEGVDAIKKSAQPDKTGEKQGLMNENQRKQLEQVQE